MPNYVANSATAPWIIYQPLIVGLGAVVLGLIANTILEWSKQRISDRALAMKVRRALIAELSVPLATFQFNAEKATEESGMDWTQLAVGQDYPLFAVFNKDLGVLSGEEITAVSKAYFYLNSLPEFVVLMDGIFKDIGPVTVGQVPPSRKVDLIQMTSKLASLLEDAVSAMKSRVRPKLTMSLDDRDPPGSRYYQRA